MVPALIAHIRARPRLALCAAIGLAVGALVPDIAHVTTRALLGWNAGVWLFLLLTLVMIAAVASVVAIIIELAAAKGPDAHHALPHILFALGTVVGSWLMVPTLFALNYASLYYQDNARGEDKRGLKFPDPDPHFHPDYADFMYFSFTIAVASQTADVSITSRPMRRLVLTQSLLSFVFNTTILAFTINIAAGLF